MSLVESPKPDPHSPGTLPVTPPFIWPEPRVHAALVHYADLPPARRLLTEADLISGVLVGAGDGTLQWLGELTRPDTPRTICLVLVLYPANPTRERHLRAIHALQSRGASAGTTLQVRLLPMPRILAGDSELTVLPPTVIQAHSTHTGDTVLSIGSVGDAGANPMFLPSVNFVFRPDAALRDAWRLWFQYLFSRAAPLTEDTLRIPHLLPAEGDLEGTLLWNEFEGACRRAAHGASAAVTVDPETGEVTLDADGKAITPWDQGATALDPLAHAFQRAYASGWLVTVDESTRIKPLSIPVKAALLGQQSERAIGALRQRQSFTLQVLGEEVETAVEKCRRVTDLLELLSYSLSQGTRWLPAAARALLEKELESRNLQGQVLLRRALGGNDPEQFVATRTKALRRDLDDMCRELAQGDAVPENRFQGILHDVARRLQQALDGRITPRAIFNRIATPDLTAAAPDENWNQPLSVLVRSARMLRESLTDPFFPRGLVGLSFSLDEWRKACDVFGDVTTTVLDAARARNELDEIASIVQGTSTAQAKCQAVWSLIRRGQPTSGRQQ